MKATLYTPKGLYVPKVGEKFLVGDLEEESRVMAFSGVEVEAISLAYCTSIGFVITFKHVALGVGCLECNSRWVKRTLSKKEKACDAIWKELDDSGTEYDLKVAMELAYDRWVTDKE